MELTINPKGVLQIDNARICYRNFSGEQTQYNREGNRNFALVIDDENIANVLIEAGWNVKIKAPREERDVPFMYLNVKVKFNGRGPSVNLVSGKRVRKLTEDTISILDRIDICNVDLDIAPSHYENISGRSGISAYLRSMEVTQELDRFEERYANRNDESEDYYD